MGLSVAVCTNPAGFGLLSCGISSLFLVVIFATVRNYGQQSHGEHVCDQLESHKEFPSKKCLLLNHIEIHRRPKFGTFSERPVPVSPEDGEYCENKLLSETFIHAAKPNGDTKMRPASASSIATKRSELIRNFET